MKNESDENINEEAINSLTGIRLRIFCFLLQQNGPIGVRAVQRALSLKTASHSNYHLQKLYELDIVDKTPQNLYVLKAQYHKRSIKVNVLAEYVLLKGKFWPKSTFFASYLVTSLLIAVVLAIFNQVDVLIVYLILSLMASIIVVTLEVWKQLKSLPWDSESE
ncbi:MAG: hypothetical protein ACXAD7_20355 [Candidatus Kariarchaeaceae archaeon]|jgi:DNA-binding transcriptional ArsR family regulator